MSTNNSKKSKKDLQRNKGEVFYGRLRRAYGIEKEKDLAQIMNLSKQALNMRKRRGNWDPQEIRDYFPDVNMGWVNSENIDDLRKLPVRINEDLNGLAIPRAEQVKIPEGGISRENQKELLSQIESIVKILKDSL